jgi:lysophospholipase L1-like esterase
MIRVIHRPRLFTASILHVCWVALATVALGAAPVVHPSWPPADGVPLTQWGKEISPDKPVLQEYPRPQLVREQWLNLNGMWEYSVAAKDADAPKSYDGKILVPFPIESVLSQVNKRIDETSRLWYRRSFQIPPAWAGQRILLHFGAVNWETTVLVNNKQVGTHRGGYDDFTFDITDALTGAGPQELVVSAWNPIEGGQPGGKQARRPEGIFYTPTTGIWQTVWLEPVPLSSVAAVGIVPDVDNDRLILRADVAGPTDDTQVQVAVTKGGVEIAHGMGEPGKPIIIPIQNPRLWWPDDPFLYDIQITLARAGKNVDSVGSYFGMRKIAIGPDEKGITRILLNNRFVLQNGLLDQGFWPDGIYTAPSDEALRYDIEVTRELGFNMTRKHVKVEPERWYYWADRLGLLVWQDMPAARQLWYKRTAGAISDPVSQFQTELQRMVEGRFNHPSIVTWVVFNEGWGLEMSRTDPEKPSDATRLFMQRMIETVRAADATRLIDPESGAGGGAWQGMNPWDIGLGDVLDFHCYGKSNGPIPEKHRASVIGEYGWGVSPVNSVGRELPEVTNPGVSALVLTQLTDVENERNGAVNYDRSLKAGVLLEKTGVEMREQTREWEGPDLQPNPATSQPSAGQPASDGILLANRRVLMLGDSITEQGNYATFIEYYLDTLAPKDRIDIISIGLSSETASGLSEKAHPFPRPCVHERLQRALDKVHPQLVMACYGMNDGIYHPQSPERMNAFKEGIEKLMAAVRKSNAQLVLLTPPPFDALSGGGHLLPAGAPDYSYLTPFEKYDDVLSDYGRWEMSLPASDATVVDLHSTMADYLKTRRKTDPNFCFSTDHIHPSPLGHLLMARAILTATGLALPETDLDKELARIMADPLFSLVAKHRQTRSAGWLDYVGYTREKTVSSDSVTRAESVAAGLQARIDQQTKQQAR